jgi:hypothetical protein
MDGVSGGSWRGVTAESRGGLLQNIVVSGGRGYRHSQKHGQLRPATSQQPLGGPGGVASAARIGILTN